jgi:hypothetical protein
LQRAGAEGLIAIGGRDQMLKVSVPVLLHPLMSVPVTVYVWVDGGLAVTLTPVVEDKPIEGLHT